MTKQNLMTEKSSNKAIKASFWYTLGNILIKGLSFLTLPIFTRIMSTSDFGLYTTYVAYESILSILLSLGINASLKSAKIQFPDRINDYVSCVVCIPIVITTIVLLLSILFQEQLGLLLGFEGYFAIIMAIQACSSAIITTYNSRISLDYSYKSFLNISIISTVGNIGTSLLLIFFLFEDNAYKGRILGTCLPLAIVSIFLLSSFFKKAKPHFNKSYISFGLRYSLPLVPHGLSQLILAQFGKIVIQRRIGNSEAGIYGFAYTVALIPQIVVQSISMAWGPFFFESYHNNKLNEIKLRSRLFIEIFAYFTIALFCVSPELTKLMADYSYWDAIYLIMPAILGVYLTFLYDFPVEIEYYYQKTNYIAVGTLFAALLNIVLCICIVPIYGYQYAVYITLFTYFIYFLYHLLVAYKLTKGLLPFDVGSLVVYSVLVCVACVVFQCFIQCALLRYSILVLYSFAMVYKFRNAIESFLHSNIQ